MNRIVLCIVSLLAVAGASSPATAKPPPAASRIETVTVYRGQALVTRTVDLPDKTGELELVIGDLPAKVVSASLHAGASGGVTVRSVQYRSRAVAAEPKPEVARLDAQIKLVNRDIFANKQMLAVAAAKGSYVGKLESFVAPTSKVEMSKGVLNPEALGQVSQQIFAMRMEIARETIELTREAEDLAETLALLQRKRSELTRGSGRTIREAVLFLTRTGKGAGGVRLSYLVESASWSPAYNVRLVEGGSGAEVEYLAQVHQMSGEDWTGVKLSLSTATPGMNARSPLLVPLWIDLTGLSTDKKGVSMGAYKYVSEYAQEQQKMSQGQYGNIQRAWVLVHEAGGAAQAGWDLNRNAAEIQGLELNVSGDVVRAYNKLRLGAEEEVLAVSYRLPGTMSLASRSDKQLVQIAALKLPGETYYQAIPLLSTYVYRAAEVVNDSKVPLLAGPYSAYIGGEFVGRGNLHLVARGQKATIGFGVDTQLRCRRELVDKSDEISWGSRIQKFHYRLRLHNFKDAPVTVRMVDRIPATKSEDIRITLGKLSAPLSTDPLYVRDRKDRGVLRWDINLPARAAGAKAADVLYEFEMRFAKDKHIGRQAAAAAKEMRKTYEDMMLKQ